MAPTDPATQTALPTADTASADAGEHSVAGDIAAELAAGDAERAKALRRMRLVATSLLVVAAIVYILTLHRDGVWGYVNATAEAAMVGALADWFAVTAIFRHPLGIPIPHTALIPRKKDMFAGSLEDFFLGYFLTADAMRERVRTMGIAERAGEWLGEPGNAETVVTRAAPIASRALGSVSEDEVRQIVTQALIPKLETEPMSHLAGSLLSEVVRDGIHTQLVDLVVDEALNWLLDNPEQFQMLLADRAPTWTPLWINGLVTDRVHTECVRWVREIRDDPGHRVRKALDDLLNDLATDLQEDPAMMERAEALKVRLLTHPQTAETVVRLWEALVRILQRSLDDPDGHVQQRIVRELRGLGDRLVRDEALREIVTDRLGAAVEVLVTTFGRDIATVISQVIHSWDGKDASRRIELHVGKDLQYIRINGTIVGGLAGFTIHALSQLLA
ncbi:MAG: DUF445 domain-containing protein [Dermatophilus congolensis]|nr:DUF445 domain-containing protein [Dermatophilus congolensis]